MELSTNKGGKMLPRLGIILGAVVMFLAFSSQAQAATAIYRSVGVGSTASLGLGNNVWSLGISGSTATFETDVANNVGVGDVLVYDTDSNSQPDAAAFIHARTDNQHFTVKSAGGGTPTAITNTTVWYLYRAYTSLAAAEAGTENAGIPVGLRNFDTWNGGKDISNATGSDEQWNIACYANGSAADTTAGISFYGWTTDDDNYIKVYTPNLSSEVGTSQRHSGTWSDLKYHIVSDNDFNDTAAIYANGVNVHIDGLQIHENEISGTGYSGIATFNVGGLTQVSNNIIRSGSDASTNGVYFMNEGTTPASTYKVWNNIIYDFQGKAFEIEDPNGTAYVYNNTAYGVNNSDVCYLATSGTVVVKNNIAQNCSDGYTGSFNASSDYNLSNLSGDAPGSHSQNSSTLTFGNLVGRDLRLASTDAAAIAGGTSLSADANLAFSTDIENATRLNWEIGADELSDVTAPTITNVTSDKTNGTYAAGEVIDIDVTFSEAVTSTGDVTVTLETGATDRTCTFTVSAATNGTCNYTVQTGDTSSDLTVSSVAGTIADASENPVTNFTPAANLAANKALVISTATETPATPPAEADTSSYVPDITISGSSVSLGSQAVTYQNSVTLNFSGKQTAVAGGQVKVYRRTKLLKSFVVDASGNWVGAVRGLKNKVYLYKFAYVNASGATVSVSPYYKIFVDTIKPKITNRSSQSAGAGAAIRIRTKDKTPITEYTYTFNNQTTTTGSPIFTVPTGTAKGAHILNVRVKDSAGNYSATKRIRVRVK